MHIQLKNKKLIFKDYRVKCCVGKSGFKKNKIEGDKSTPKGTFKLKYVLYRIERVKLAGCKLKKKVIKKNMGWCDDPKSKFYNKLIKFPFNYSAEKLYIKNNTYDIIVVIDYNLKPIKPYKGSAIFIHVSKKNYSSTNGCIAISKKDLKKLLTIVNKNTKIIIN